MNAIILEEKSAFRITVVNGQDYMHDAKGNLVPRKNVSSQDQLEDETVRKIIAFAADLSAQITRFRDHTMLDLGSFDALLAQEYGASIGGKKGNKTYQTFDGLMRVQVQVSDLQDFGPQLQIAKSLIDDYLRELVAESSSEIQTLVTHAFNTDKEGQINKAGLFMLMRVDIADERWKRAMQAIRDSMRITGSKEYVRFYQRTSIEDGWQAISIDLARA
ncbi:sulfate transporter [Rhizobium sp. 58]|nr:sulfate transporter [Rhizobium sp. 58]